MKSSMRYLLLIVLISITSITHAKDYKVEMVFFTHVNAPSNFYPDPTGHQPDLSDAISLEHDNNSQAFRRLGSNTYTLAGIASRLRSSSQYRLIHHVAWKQPGLGKNSSRSVAIHAGRDFSSLYPERTYRYLDASDDGISINHADLHELDGTVEIELGRFLHVNTDLVFRKQQQTGSTPSDSSPVQQARLNDYRIKADRRMRSGELHYLDHPVLGIIVEITPL